MTFRIFVDSGLNLTDDLLDRYGIEAISYTARLDGEEFLCYEKGRDYEEAAKRYYDALRQGKPAATSLINTATIEEIIAPTLERGEDALFIPISSGVSGTYRQAQIAAEEMASRYEGKLYVLDSLGASFGAGMLAVRGAELRQEGKSAKETLEILDELKWQVAQYFTVDDLEYLKRGGRISTVAAIIGSLLKVKPLLRGNDEGKIVLASKVVGRRKVLHA
ncbi:MAG: DegV family protein, partial [Christensenellaceae bacterium]